MKKNISLFWTLFFLLPSTFLVRTAFASGTPVLIIQNKSDWYQGATNNVTVADNTSGPGDGKIVAGTITWTSVSAGATVKTQGYTRNRRRVIRRV